MALYPGLVGALTVKAVAAPSKDNGLARRYSRGHAKQQALCTRLQAVEVVRGAHVVVTVLCPQMASGVACRLRQ